MAFDIGTAKPIQQGGFDIQTAKPIQQNGMDVNAESVGERSFAAPPVASDIPESQASNEAQYRGQIQEDQASVADNIVGAGEAALTIGTGATSGTAGMIFGTLKGLAEQVASGNFGTAEAARLIEDEAMKFSQEATYSPRTEAGQDIIKDIGDVAAPLAAIPPIAPEIAVLTQAARPGIAAATTAAAKSLKPATGTAKALFNVQSPTKQRIAKLIESGSTDSETAGFKLGTPQARPENPTRLQEFLNVGGPRVKRDATALESIKQGFDEGVIAAIKGSSPSDKIKMSKMVNIMERGKKNKLFAAKNRPSDVAGDSLLARVKSIRSANREAGKDIDTASKELQGKPIDISGAAASFADDLDSMGVSLKQNTNGNFIPDFTQSQLSPGDRGPIKEVIRQMNIKSAGGVDGLSAHKMKRVIDNNVTYGRVKTGISGDAERALKKFRADLDTALDSSFPEYNRANTVYSETISALDSIQDVAGTKMDLSGGNADKALGTLLRRTLSNAQSRIRLIDSIDEIESAAKKHGGSKALKIEGSGLGNDDLLTQVLFVDELDSVFGPVARTSFQGQIDQALKQGVSATTTKAGAVDMAIDMAGRAAEKVRGINEEGAFQSIKKLLRE